MNLSGQTKLLLIGVVILLFIMYFNNSSEPMNNEGSLAFESEVKPEVKPEIKMLAESNNIPFDLDTIASQDSVVSQDSDADQKLKKKFSSKNKASDGEYKKTSFSEGSRSNGPSDFDNFFDQQNSLLKDGQNSANDFAPNDSTNDGLAKYNPGTKRKITDEDIFKSDEYLPQDQNKDWFEVMPEPISVKNRHLINVSRPVGIDTIGSSHRNASYDVRGTPIVAKSIVSPFLNSSIEPDLSIRGLC
jgi:hypothetical protein